MSTLFNDLKYAFRRLAKKPGFTAIALITLALGIGANTIMLSISDLLLIQAPRGVKAREQLAVLSIKKDKYARLRYSEYLTLRENSRLAFSDLVAEDIGFTGLWSSLVHGDRARQVKTRYVSANYFAGLGDNLVRGRGFLPEEERRGSTPVVVLGHPLWQRLGGDPKLIGEYITLNSTRCQVVGVAVKGFGGVTFDSPELWLPLGSYRTVVKFDPAWSDRHKVLWLDVVGRLKPEVTLSVAQAQVNAMIPQFKREYPERWSQWSSINLRPPGRNMLYGDPEQMIQERAIASGVLMAVSAIILAIACLNLANMLIVQGASRQREIATRLALGGSRWCIIRQLLIESLLLALLGGVLGVLLAFWGTRIVNIWVISLSRGTTAVRFGLSLRVLAGTLGLCLITTLLFGLKPALRLSKSDIVGEMKASGGRVLGSVRRKRGAVSVTGQIALSVTLMLIATLLTRSALEIAKPEARVSLKDKLIVHIDPLSVGYDPVKARQIGTALADNLLSLPEVKALGTSNKVFYGGSGPYVIGEYQSEAARPLARDAAIAWAGRDYFTAMEIPLLQGRRFNQLDYAPDAEEVAIIDESLARRLRPDGNALGCLVQWGLFTKEEVGPCRVVGIVAHLPNLEDGQVHAQIYFPHKWDKLPPMLYLHVANTGVVDGLRQRITAEIHTVDAGISVKWVKTLAQIHDSHYSVKKARTDARLGLTAGVTALFLAALGIYAIKGHMVVSRTSEIGIRMALGATHRSIIGMVLREGLVLMMVGLIAGLATGLMAAKALANLFYGVSPMDPISMVVTVVLIGAVSLLAGFIPARRAARVDPMEALRHE